MFPTCEEKVGGSVSQLVHHGLDGLLGEGAQLVFAKVQHAEQRRSLQTVSLESHQLVAAQREPLQTGQAGERVVTDSLNVISAQRYMRVSIIFQ